MKRLPGSVIAIVVYLAAFYNLERLWSNFTIQPFFYIFIPFIIVITISIAFVRRQSYGILTVTWGAIFLIFQLLIFPFNDAVQSDSGILMFILETTLLGLGIILAKHLAEDMEDFVDAVKTLSMNQTSKIPILEDSKEILNTEVYRCRRFSHPLNVVIIEPQEEAMQSLVNRSVKDILTALSNRFVLLSLGRALRSRLRRTDMIFEQRERKRFVILTPETKEEGSQAVLKRVSRAAEELGVPIQCGAASFPNDSFTIDGLIKEAELDLIHCTVSERVARGLPGAYCCGK